MKLDGNILLQLLYSSARAYKSLPADRQHYRSETLQCPSEDVYCRLWYIEGEVWVAFRGTDSARDLQLDLQFHKTPVPELCPISKARIHYGFRNAYFCDSFRTKLKEKIRERGAARIYFTGHSLGGAMALLAALDFRCTDPKPEIWVVTFGAPRIGNRAFRKFFDEKILECVQVRNANDAVTKLPPALFGYRHVGSAWHVGSWRVFGIYSLKEHRQKEYFHHLLPVVFR